MTEQKYIDKLVNDEAFFCEEFSDVFKAIEEYKRGEIDDIPYSYWNGKSNYRFNVNFEGKTEGEFLTGNEGRWGDGEKVVLCCCFSEGDKDMVADDGRYYNAYITNWEEEVGNDYEHNYAIGSVLAQVPDWFVKYLCDADMIHYANSQIDKKGFDEYLAFVNLAYPDDKKLTKEAVMEHIVKLQEKCLDSKEVTEIIKELGERLQCGEICGDIIEFDEGDDGLGNGYGLEYSEEGRIGLYIHPVYREPCPDYPNEENLTLLPTSCDVGAFQSNICVEIFNGTVAPHIVTIVYDWIDCSFNELQRDDNNERYGILEHLKDWQKDWADDCYGVGKTDYAIISTCGYFGITEEESKPFAVRFDDLSKAVSESKTLSELTQRISKLEKLYSVPVKVNGVTVDVPITDKFCDDFKNIANGQKTITKTDVKSVAKETKGNER